MVAYGNYDARIAEGALNLPVVDGKAALRIAGQYQKRDGWTKNIGIGDDADDLNSRALRVSLLLEPFEGLKNTTIIDYYRNHSTGGGRSEEHTSELQSLMRRSYAVFCLKTKRITTQKTK